MSTSGEDHFVVLSVSSIHKGKFVHIHMVGQSDIIYAVLRQIQLVINVLIVDCVIGKRIPHGILPATTTVHVHFMFTFAGYWGVVMHH